MRRMLLPSVLLPLLCLAAPVGAQAGPDRDDVYLQQRATFLNDRIDLAVRERKLTRKKAAQLRLAVGRVQTSVGNQQSRNGGVDPRDADRLNQQLTDVERALPRRHDMSPAGHPVGNDALPSAEVTAFQKTDARLRYRNARIERDTSGCAIYQGMAPNGDVHREQLHGPSGQPICSPR